MPPPTHDADRLARSWGMPVAMVHAWLAIEPQSWARSHAKMLHSAGLTPAQGQELYTRLPPEVREDIGRLVDAGRMAALDTEHLHWWARSGLLKPQVTANKRGRRTVVFTRWVTEARAYIAATGGDQRLAALAAAAGLSLAEVGDRVADRQLDEESLRVLAALRDAGALFDLPPII